MFIIFILIIFILIFHFKKTSKIKIVINKKEFYVNKCDDQYYAALIMNIIYTNVFELLKNMNEKKKIISKKEIIRVTNIWKNMTIIETDYDSNDTSFMIAKGDSLYICIRNKKKKIFTDINTLMYVILHELAHIFNPKYEHDDVFTNFNIELLIEAINKNFYKYIDYNKKNIEYCGITINKNILTKYYNAFGNKLQ